MKTTITLELTLTQLHVLTTYLNTSPEFNTSSTTPELSKDVQILSPTVITPSEQTIEELDPFEEELIETISKRKPKMPLFGRPKEAAEEYSKESLLKKASAAKLKKEREERAKARKLKKQQEQEAIEAENAKIKNDIKPSIKPDKLPKMPFEL